MTDHDLEPALLRKLIVVLLLLAGCSRGDPAGYGMQRCVPFEASPNLGIAINVCSSTATQLSVNGSTIGQWRGIYDPPCTEIDTQSTRINTFTQHSHVIEGQLVPCNLNDASLLFDTVPL